jgi:hypothetical protein
MKREQMQARRKGGHLSPMRGALPNHDSFIPSL